MVRYKNKIIIIVGIATVLFSNYLGHTAPPFSISFTPFLLPIFTVLVLFVADYRISIKFLLIVLMILVNDILIRLFAGGAHDSEGLGWIFLFLLIGLFITLIFVLISLFFLKGESKKEYSIALVSSIIIIISYLSYFNTLGMNIVLPPKIELKDAMKENVFVSTIEFFENPLIIEKDTIYFENGWIEKQINLNHLGFFKKTEITNKYYIAMDIITQSHDSTQFWFEINNDSSFSYSKYYSGKRYFEAEKQLGNYKLYVFRNKEMVKEIIIK